jgi:hypothetical protein
MDSVNQNYDFLRKLAKTKSIKVRNKMLANATTSEILAVLEICVNILRYRVRLTDYQRKRLAAHAEYLRKFSRSRTEKTAKVILQRGEGAILPALILPILAQFIASRFIK